MDSLCSFYPGGIAAYICFLFMYCHFSNVCNYYIYIIFSSSFLQLFFSENKGCFKQFKIIEWLISYYLYIFITCKVERVLDILPSRHDLFPYPRVGSFPSLEIIQKKLQELQLTWEGKNALWILCCSFAILSWFDLLSNLFFVSLLL